MKKKITLLVAMAGAVMLFAGCSSLQTAGADKFNGQQITASGTGVAHISGYASGFYFLWIPLFSGSTTNPGTIAWNTDSCNVAAVTKMVTAKSRALNAPKTIDLSSTSNSVNVPIPFPFLFSWRTVTVSGNAVR